MDEVWAVQLFNQLLPSNIRFLKMSRYSLKKSNEHLNFCSTESYSLWSFDVTIRGSWYGSPSSILVYWNIIYHAAQMSSYKLPICQGLGLHSQRDFAVDSCLTPKQSFCVGVLFFLLLGLSSEIIFKKSIWIISAGDFQSSFFLKISVAFFCFSLEVSKRHLLPFPTFSIPEQTYNRRGKY